MLRYILSFESNSQKNIRRQILTAGYGGTAMPSLPCVKGVFAQMEGLVDGVLLGTKSCSSTHIMDNLEDVINSLLSEYNDNIEWYAKCRCERDRYIENFQL